MNEPNPTQPNDPRLQSALEDYFDRLDRHEPFDRENFFREHADIAEELELFISTEDEVRKLVATSFYDISEIPTGTFSLQPPDTLPRKSSGSKASKSAVLTGQFGRYRIVRAVGQGAMGTVYLAEDTQLQRPVALKTPQFSNDSEEELLERFYREARAAALLRNPHICPVYDVGEIDGKHYITMAYIEGLPLSEFVNPAVPQSERQILICIGKIAHALQEAHNHGIVHRDLKPANIMVDRQGEPVIMDFGLAHQIRPGEEMRLTQTGMILGSPAYMSPEQVEGDPAKVGPATDQYSLGVILFELLTGQVPFVGSLSAVMGQIVTKRPTPPSRYRPGLDPQVEALCLKMLAKDPAERFASLAAVVDELAAIVRTPESTTGAPAPAIRLSKPPTRNSWLVWTVAAAAVVGLLAAAVLYVRVGKTMLEIQIDDPGVQVAVTGSTITLTGPANEEIKVEPGEHELTIVHGGLKFKTGSFKLEKGNEQVLKVSLAGSDVAAKLGDSPLTVRPIASPAGPRLLFFPFEEVAAQEGRKAWARHLDVPAEMTNSLGIQLELIPPGEFQMGANEGQHRVRITHPFYLGKYEVTRGQFAQFVAATGFQTQAEKTPAGSRLDNNQSGVTWDLKKPYTWRKPGFAQDDDHPVVEVAWSDAVAFCEWLSHKEGKKYRLPTEAEWEYACRAGTLTRFYNGNDLQGLTKIGNVADASAKAVFPHWDEKVTTSDGYIYSSPVGKFQPNNFGLYDTLGNAAEWCSDWFAAEYDKSITNDPTGPAVGNAKVGRGGSFTRAPGTRYRYYGNEFFRRPDWGFRLACDVPAAPAKVESTAGASPK